MLWNVKGLDSTIGFLEATPPNADLLLLTETWMHAAAQPPPLTEYHCFGLSRPFQQSAGRPSGGLACYVRKHLASHVSVWKYAQDGSCIWMKISKAAGLQADLFLCLAYFCPEKSTFYDNPAVLDPFENLTKHLAEIKSSGAHVMLAGDFNARTARLPDAIPAADHADIPDVTLPNIHMLPAGSAPRQSSDATVNPFGKKLIALCQDASLLILNGRVNGDAQGQYTCHTHNGQSLVDYFIASPDMVTPELHLHVDSLPPESDHCQLYLRVPICPVSASRPQSEVPPVKPRSTLR